MNIPREFIAALIELGLALLFLALSTTFLVFGSDAFWPSGSLGAPLACLAIAVILFGLMLWRALRSAAELSKGTARLLGLI